MQVTMDLTPKMIWAQALVEEVQKDGGLDAIVSKNLRNKRKEEMMSMDKPAVVKLCEAAGVEPVVKDISIGP